MGSRAAGVNPPAVRFSASFPPHTPQPMLAVTLVLAALILVVATDQVDAAD